MEIDCSAGDDLEESIEEVNHINTVFQTQVDGSHVRRKSISSPSPRMRCDNHTATYTNTSAYSTKNGVQTATENKMHNPTGRKTCHQTEKDKMTLHCNFSKTSNMSAPPYGVKARVIPFFRMLCKNWAKGKINTISIRRVYRKWKWCKKRKMHKIFSRSGHSYIFIVTDLERCRIPSLAPQ